jgi:hypothetical protein
MRAGGTEAISTAGDRVGVALDCGVNVGMGSDDDCGAGAREPKAQVMRRISTNTKAITAR